MTPQGTASKYDALVTEFLVGRRIRPDVSPDAVVVVPGVMGSSLESSRGVLWGMHRLGWYLKEWTAVDSALDMLALDNDERRGVYGRIRATGLLRRPAWAPFLQAIEPYGELLAGISRVVVHPAAVLEFPYDWRLPIAYNARRLEIRARNHLASWCSHREYQRFRRELPDARPARLVIIAHSMGGLLLRSLPDDLDVRATVTLGTPFDGSAKAVMMLNAGRGAPVPLPRSRLKKLARTLPGLHDLLPTYRCLDDASGDRHPARLTPDIVASLGGDRNLAETSFSTHRAASARAIPGHRALIGINQPTISTLTVRDGIVEGHPYTFEPLSDGFARDRHGVLVRTLKRGDGTVPDNSARDVPSHREIFTLAQQHGPIAKAPEAINFVCAVLCERDVDAPRLGQGDLSIDVPDLLANETKFVVSISGVEGPNDATVTIRDEDGLAVDKPRIEFGSNGPYAPVGPLHSGIYQVELAGGASTAVNQRVMITDL